MRKYRILQRALDSYYAQTKNRFWEPWKSIDNKYPFVDCSEHFKFCKVDSFERASDLIEKRKDYELNNSQYPKIYKIK
jgi:hypothetical protein